MWVMGPMEGGGENWATGGQHGHPVVEGVGSQNDGVWWGWTRDGAKTGVPGDDVCGYACVGRGASTGVTPRGRTLTGPGANAVAASARTAGGEGPPVRRPAGVALFLRPPAFLGHPQAKCPGRWHRKQRGAARGLGGVPLAPGPALPLSPSSLVSPPDSTASRRRARQCPKALTGADGGAGVEKWAGSAWILGTAPSLHGKKIELT